MNGSLRYSATNLGATLEAQGRQQVWLAAKLGISKSLMSKVIAGTRTLDGAEAERVAELLNTPLFLLFELRERSETQSLTERSKVA